MDESHWMKCTNTRHLSPLVMYKYPNYCLLSSCSFSSYLITYILTGTSILQFCSFACVYHFPVAHHPFVLLLHYLWFTSTDPSFIYGCHIKHKTRFLLFVCFVFLCNEICTPGWEAHFQLHFSQNNWLWPKCV